MNPSQQPMGHESVTLQNPTSTTPQTTSQEQLTSNFPKIITPIHSIQTANTSMPNTYTLPSSSSLPSANLISKTSSLPKSIEITTKMPQTHEIGASSVTKLDSNEVKTKEQEVSGEKAAKRPKLDESSLKKQTELEEKFSKWQPQDDLLLKEAVQTISSFDKIARSVKFSQKFSALQLEERWRAILYEPLVSISAAQKMSLLPSLNKRVLWSDVEEEILKKEVNATGAVNFQYILEKYRDKFHSSRTAKSLEAHYYRMKRTGALPPAEGAKPAAPATAAPSTAAPATAPLATAAPGAEEPKRRAEVAPAAPSGSMVHGPVRSIEQIEEGTADFVEMEDELMSEPVGEQAADREKLKQMHAEYKKQELVHQQRIIALENELETEGASENVLAVLKGKKIRYRMTTKEIVLGRKTNDVLVDVDLLQEGPAARVSRKQAIIKLKSSGDFFVKNIGKCLIFVDGRPVETPTKKRLTDKCLIEIGNIRFIFEINKTLLAQLKKEL